jgi:hypothetical protein
MPAKGSSRWDEERRKGGRRGGVALDSDQFPGRSDPKPEVLAEWPTPVTVREIDTDARTTTTREVPARRVV